VKVLRILGIRGIPAAHGGFETFAEQAALYFVSQGWRVIVYCQESGAGPFFQDEWQNVERVHIPVVGNGPGATVRFDWQATLHAGKHKDLCLTLGYNTAIFCALLRLKCIPNVINMDGIEWSRAKWGKIAKTWFLLNDWAGCWLGNHLVADHPEIKEHLKSRVRADKITTIAYGADKVAHASTDFVTQYGLEPGKFLTVIARPEPENSLLEIVSGFSRERRGLQLAVLGKYDPANAYHRAVKEAAGDEVKFLGAIYDKPVVQALRFHSWAYVHGHQVGGTNPSLVEALGAGNAVVAHDNRFNRWVVGDGGVYFDGADGFARVLSELATMPEKVDQMRAASTARYEAEFTWDKICREYEELLTRFLPA
jgi:glycosyltransferase involved in cell wall biosynthesis